MAHGWSATKEFDLDEFANVFQSNGMHAMAYDHRSVGHACLPIQALAMLIRSSALLEGLGILTLDRTHLDWKSYHHNNYQTGPMQSHMLRVGPRWILRKLGFGSVVSIIIVSRENTDHYLLSTSLSSFRGPHTLEDTFYNSVQLIKE